MSAHLIIRDHGQPFGDMIPHDYDDELLLMAHDLANRLLSAFENTTLGIPYPRVSQLFLMRICLTRHANFWYLNYRLI